MGSCFTSSIKIPQKCENKNGRNLATNALRNVTRRSGTTQSPRKCPICNGCFSHGTCDRLVNRHIDGCLAFQEIVTSPIVEPFSGRGLRWQFGIKNESGCIEFPEPNFNDKNMLPYKHSLSYSFGGLSSNVDSRIDDEPICDKGVARFLLNVIRNGANPSGGSEETTQKRYMEFAGACPRLLSVFTGFPFEQKKKWFYAQLNAMRVNFSTSWVILDVSRDEFLVSSFNQFRSLGTHDFHKEFKYRFAGEPASDAGGLTREWFTLISEHLFHPNNALFLYSDVDNLTYQINPNSSINENHLEYFSFVGKVIGKAIFDKQTILCPFARPLLKQLLKKPVLTEDVAFVDEHLYTSLEWMLSNSINDILFESFCVQEECFGEQKIIDLKPNGRNISVTDLNKSEYIRLLIKYKVFDSIKDQLAALAKGLWEVIPVSLLKIFDFQELELLINGLPNLEIDDWRANTAYDGEYYNGHVLIEWFWETVTDMFNDEERARLLQFATGTSRVPAEGFKGLESNRGQKAKFTIRSVPWSDCAPLPRAHTCFNRLDLPLYRTKADLERYITYAVRLDVTGFGLED